MSELSSLFSKKIKSVLPKTKMLIFGFTRIMETKYNIQSIPIMIMYLFCIFYQQNDHFRKDDALIFKLMNENRTVKRNNLLGGWDKKIYGNNMINASKELYHQSLANKIIKIYWEITINYIPLTVWTSSSFIPCQYNISRIKFGIIGGNQEYVFSDEIMKSNELITIALYCRKGNIDLRFYKNNVLQSEYHNINPTFQYQIFIEMNAPKTMCTINKYECTISEDKLDK